ncbi:MAG: 2,3,4,5-tetrahydropyridine-2,6-dicarboxylate N-succinyltransferase [Micrococcales bacterium]|nr:2,3,4,5-tetrahydropyridine-2,6-dicarboxylate N-succinyltransferase [Micrococcales bacterium]NBR54950.1 2,3,4,5-tetrahydropyridine-2,6-dicarboxylate N-succinyltransferase [Micrococcales bacterium]NBR60457.1 2,3,4,5-tetrahydropyridine-2,6-dicarboxylate N-succinyltransferase [Actinomycetota bacterium]NBY44121.1 2,3,4,5-tetrahydropyridine-2,6-dicarboxylate N-succinyltransferase [Micrococcales bacterium]
MNTSTQNLAWAAGLVTEAADGKILDAWYPSPALGAAPEGEASVLLEPNYQQLIGFDARRNVEVKPIKLEINLTEPVSSTPDAYLRLHLLSHLLVRPNGLNLENLLGNLPNVAFTSIGAMTISDYEKHLPTLRASGVTVHSIDKFPRLVDYVVPKGVRIADANRVRLGAHLSPGTTIMHEGFVNFNAGTLGIAMVEGRIAQGVIVGNGSDIGGGASIMGTLSGGGKEKVSIGERALLGANAGIGISIGDDSVVEAGLYVTAGTKVTLIEGASERTVKAIELSGQPNLLFRRNSVTGRVEVIQRNGVGITLNPQLHSGT